LGFSGGKFILSISNFDGLVDLITQTSAAVITGDTGDGEGNNFDGAQDATTTPVPAGGNCDVSASPGNPVLNAIVSGLSAAPGLDVSLSADGTLKVEIDVSTIIPAPVITPDPVTDPGVIVVSPADQG
jgi:hypothetical protein